jgi:hypothetical protein
VRNLEYDSIEGVDPNLLSLDLHLPAIDAAGYSRADVNVLVGSTDDSGDGEAGDGVLRGVLRRLASSP